MLERFCFSKLSKHRRTTEKLVSQNSEHNTRLTTFGDGLRSFVTFQSEWNFFNFEKIPWKYFKNKISLDSLSKYLHTPHPNLQHFHHKNLIMTNCGLSSSSNDIQPEFQALITVTSTLSNTCLQRRYCKTMQKVIENVFFWEKMKIYLNLCKISLCEGLSEMFVDILASILRILSSYERPETMEKKTWIRLRNFFYGRVTLKSEIGSCLLEWSQKDIIEWGKVKWQVINFNSEDDVNRKEKHRFVRYWRWKSSNNNRALATLINRRKWSFSIAWWKSFAFVIVCSSDFDEHCRFFSIFFLLWFIDFLKKTFSPQTSDFYLLSWTSIVEVSSAWHKSIFVGGRGNSFLEQVLRTVFDKVIFWKKNLRILKNI